MNVGSWLQSLGLAQYEATFRDNAIDLDVLPELTESDLEKLGIPMGTASAFSRRLQPWLRLRRHQALHRSARTPSAERRQLTVMFCDLVGSTALSARLDPEDMREIIGAYHRCCAEQSSAIGGFVAKYMGDGVLAYFGYPQAHEHDAERAVRAGLAIVEAVREA